MTEFWGALSPLPMTSMDCQLPVLSVHLYSLPGVLVSDLNTLDSHSERRLRVVGQASGPLNDTLLIVAVTTSPDPDAHSGGGLREVLSANSIGVLEGADGLAVDGPGEGIASPVKGVGVDLLGVGNSTLNHTVICGSIALGKVSE